MNMMPTPKAFARRYVLLGILAIIALIFGFGVWATKTRISGAIIATGKIEVERNKQIVQHPAGGVIAQVFVDDGDFVDAGDVLLRLDTETLTAELAHTQDHLFDLLSRQGRLRAEFAGGETLAFDAALTAQAAQYPALGALLDGQQQLFSANLVSLRNETTLLNQRRLQVDAQVDGIIAQTEALTTQLNLIETALGTQQSLLSRGLSHAGAVLELEREKARLQGSLGELRASKAQAKERIAEAEIEIVQRVSHYRGQSVATSRDLAEPIRRLRHQAQRLQSEIAAAEIRAPMSGIVYQMTAQAPRSVLRPAEPVLYLIPQDRPRVIVAQVPPQHIDQVRIGQEVKMRLSALDMRITPEVFGYVTHVSADAIADELRGGYFFRVEAVLRDGELAKLPAGAVLLPGMPVETFIQTGDHAPIVYLIKPVSDYFARAFRES